MAATDLVERLAARLWWMRRYALVMALAWSCLYSLAAQEQAGQPPERLPPFEDPVLHEHLQRILRHMDGFNADSSMHGISEALLLVNGQDDPEALYYLLSYRAEVLYYEGLFNEAMKDLDRCGQLAEELGDSLLMANVYNLKGLLHENIQDSQESLPFMRAALAWFPVRPKSRYPVTELHHIHGNLGSYLMQLGMLDSADHHLHLSLELASQAGASRAMAVALWSLGTLALRWDLPDSALSCFERSVNVAREARDFDVMLDGISGLAEAQWALGRPEAALAELRRGREHQVEHPNAIGLATRRNFQRRASVLYRKMGRDAEALEAIGAWHRMDSAIAAQNTRTALSTQAELLISDRELAIERLERERTAEALQRVRTTRTIIAVGGFLLVLALTGSYLAYASRQRGKQRLAELEVQRLQQEAMIAEFRLREQVGRDMHDDLGAGLSALKLKSEMALRRSEDPAQREMLGTLATTAGDLIRNMRQIIWTMNNDQGSLEDLVVYAGNYARTYLDEHAIALRLKAPDRWPDIQLTMEQRRNIFLVIKEALHNVVKHAQAQAVELEFAWSEGLQVTLVDDGTGIPRNAQLGVGNGLRNMARRVEVLGGTFHLAGREGLSGPAGGTRLWFHVPLATN